VAITVWNFVEGELGLSKLWGMLHHVNSPFVTLTTPRDDSTHRRGNYFPAFIIPRCRLWRPLREGQA
jgi:hypothetical protein